MKLQYIIPVAVALGLIAFLNFGTTTVKPVAKDGHNHQPAAPMADNKAMPSFSLDSLIETEKVKLSPEIQTNISLLENNIARETDRAQRIADLENLGNQWQKAKRNIIGAYYIGQSGKLENSEKKLNFAANLLSEELNKQEGMLMGGIKSWMHAQIIDLYNTSLNLNPLNDSVKLDLAIAYLSAEDPMKGVEQLLDVVKRDSTNIPANIILGKMAIQSGQLDKAIERGKTVLRVNPKSIDAYLFMGEAYKQMGDKQKAIELFTGAKKLMNNPELSKDIDEYIATF